MRFFYPPRSVIGFFTLLSASVLLACSGDPELTGEDVGVDSDSVLDDVEIANADAADADTGPILPSGEFCDSCNSDSDCLDGNKCIEMLGGERVCGAHCTLDDNDCPDDSYCTVIDNNDTTQCVPDALTCTDQCAEISCPSGEFCDPLSGDCLMEARICETGCQFDSQCGDPEDYRCLGTGAPDNETICTITCDPTISGADGTLECPSDFFCVPLLEDGDEGVCYPLARTCIDRCLDHSCAADQNCDPFTGDCVDPIAGACEIGCQIDADCGGQDDTCLDLGIGDGAHCWQDCTTTQNCPEGYECSGLLGLTRSLCIPPAQQCTECYDAACFPQGICNPISGECMPHPEDCLVDGCDDENTFCEPISRECVEVDRICNGDTWAIDCDNVISRCTTQRSNTEGICATICFDDEDCTDNRECTPTTHGDLCLTPDLGGAGSCGTLNTPNEEVGQPCGSGASSCPGITDCIETGAVPGFCSHNCTGDDDCPSGSICGNGPDDTAICLPAQCTCAGDPRLPVALNAGWQTALNESGLTVCDLSISPESLLDLPVSSASLSLKTSSLKTSLSNLLTKPIFAMGTLRKNLEMLDDSAASPGDLLVAMSTILELPVISTQPTLGDAPDLIDALSTFTETAGGSLNASEVATELIDIPAEIQELAAHILFAIDDAYQARQDAFDTAGLDVDMLELLFEKSHRLLLPFSEEQATLDIDDPDVAQALQAFPIAELAQIAANLAATIDMAIVEASIDPSLIDDEFFVIVDTPAGAVVIGDASDNLYDEDAGIHGPLALVLDIGGDNTYRVPVAANQSIENGVSISIDLGGSDLYTYPKVGDPLDGDRLLESDLAGRKTPQGQDGAVSLSETGRQGVGRLGIGMLFDRGAGVDTYETLRLGQGAAILGVGAVFDQGTDATSFIAEAFSQGAAFYGVGLLSSTDGDNSYRLWQAGQGFGAASGIGLLYDRQGNDNYTAVTGLEDDEDLLYYSPADGGNANRSLAQGAAAGGDGVAAGIGILRDYQGHDSYTVATYAQGFAEDLGIGILADKQGDDQYQARGYSQGTGQNAAAGFLLDTGGNDEFNQSTQPQQFGQGVGYTLGWGAFLVEGGENIVRYSTPGGGLGIDGGFGFAFFDGGPNIHHNIGGGLGLAAFNAEVDSPQARAWTAGFFIQTGASEDSYSHPVESLAIENDSTWRQDDEDVDHALGVGVDQ